MNCMELLATMLHGDLKQTRHFVTKCLRQLRHFSAPDAVLLPSQSANLLAKLAGAHRVTQWSKEVACAADEGPQHWPQTLCQALQEKTLNVIWP